jgi:hypothetical protein
LESTLRHVSILNYLLFLVCSAHLPAALHLAGEGQEAHGLNAAPPFFIFMGFFIIPGMSVSSFQSFVKFFNGSLYCKRPEHAGELLGGMRVCYYFYRLLEFLRPGKIDFLGLQDSIQCHRPHAVIQRYSQCSSY